MLFLSTHNELWLSQTQRLANVPERMLFLSDNQYQVAIHDKVHYDDEMNVYMIANDCKKIGRSTKLYHY